MEKISTNVSAPDAQSWPANYVLANSRAALVALAARIAAAQEFAFRCQFVGTSRSTANPWRHKAACVAIFVDGQAYAIPVGHESSSNVPASLFRDLLAHHFSDPAVRRIAHEGKVDGHFIRETLGVEVGAFHIDGYVQSRMLDPDKSGLLRECATRHDVATSAQARVTDASWSKADPKMAFAFACAEVETVASLSRELARKAALRPKIDKLIRDLEMPFFNSAFKSERLGVAVDVEYIDKTLRPSVASSYADAARACAIFIEPHLAHVGARSVADVLADNDKLTAVMFDKVGIPEIVGVTLKGKDKRRSLDKDAIEQLQDEFPVLAAVRAYRQAVSMKSLVDALPAYIVDDRIHPTIDTLAAETGRVSMKAPALMGMQDVVRDAIIPEPGCVFVSIDISQQEMRLVAHFSKDPILKRAFEAGEDVYDAIAARSLGNPTPQGRKIAKAAQLGALYGLGLESFAKRSGLSIAAAQSAYARLKPASIERFRADCVTFARRTGFSQSILGRERPIPGIESQDPSIRAAAERLAVNGRIQPSAVDQSKLAVRNVERLVAAQGWPLTIRLTVHDEIVLNVQETWLRANHDAIAQIAKTVEEALPLTVPVKCDIEIGMRWGTKTPFETFMRAGLDGPAAEPTARVAAPDGCARD